ncbi:PREDICTED: uncharacterized protein LOC105316831 [Amphimedon queenslandica]|uniref:G-patch domain-containing protein n=1 Tax=Amphimedon queenslandica TaxID=400682 RepID=A0A1X7VFH3_AMPQE|nr:PREDICTED: uncharacterized protein LOC105316831 [Amphimedon queenslandica]|eukprot:XP_011410356.1 PREDICTED: uncharacterized protein LOC105316831 [Amphimedon queenslandica]
MAATTSTSPHGHATNPTHGLHRAPWESKRHWLCRRKFVEDHKDVHGLKKAIGLSMVWANINFLGCQYSSKVQSEVEYYPVPEENEIERWLKVHPDILDDEEDARKGRQWPPTGKRPTSSNSQLTSEEESLTTASKKSKIDPPDSSNDMIPFETLTDQIGSFISMMRSKSQGTDQSEESDGNIANKNWNQSNNHGNPSKHTPNETTLSRDEIIKKFGKICLCNSCFPENVNISRLSFLAAKSRLRLHFGFSETESFSPLSLYAGDCLMGKWSGTSKKEMKHQACTEIIAEVLAYQEREGGSPPVCPASKQTMVDRRELMRSGLRIDSGLKIDEGNKGHQLLLKMGWKGEGGLGGGQTNHPLVLVEPRTSSKQGFGGSACSALSQDEIRARLTKFLSNKDETQLRFPAGLSSEDRKLIHKLSGQFDLLHRSHGKDDERYLTVTKRTDHIESDRFTEEPCCK